MILTPLTCLEGGALADLHPGLRYLARQTRMPTGFMPLQGACRCLAAAPSIPEHHLVQFVQKLSAPLDWASRAIHRIVELTTA